MMDLSMGRGGRTLDACEEHLRSGGTETAPPRSPLQRGALSTQLQKAYGRDGRSGKTMEAMKPFSIVKTPGETSVEEENKMKHNCFLNYLKY